MVQLVIQALYMCFPVWRYQLAGRGGGEREKSTPTFGVMMNLSCDCHPRRGRVNWVQLKGQAVCGPQEKSGCRLQLSYV